MSSQDTLVTPADEVNPLLTADDVMTAAPGRVRSSAPSWKPS